MSAGEPARASLPTLRIAAPPLQATPYNNRLDALRGFAAWSVMVVHGFGYGGEDGSWPLSATNEYVRNLHFSHAAVLLFFIVSGYVIGLTNQGEFNRDRAVAYLRKRAVRILPLYWVAIMAGWLAWRWVSPGNLMANAFFLQNSAAGIQPLAGNRPVWSLHYEVVYYLGFLLLWAFRPRLWPLAAILLMITVCGWFLAGPLDVVGGWAAGAVFWVTGLLLAWFRPRAGHQPVISSLLLLFAANHLWPGEILLRGIGFPYAGDAALLLSDFALLPGAILVFCAFAQLDFRGLRAITWLAWLVPVVTCLGLLAMGRLFENVPWTLAAIATALAVPMRTIERDGWSAPLFKIFRPLGRISYGTYLLHYPCATFAVWLYPWGNSRLNYLGGVATWIALTFFLAWLFEIRVQPLLVARFRAAKS